MQRDEVLAMSRKENEGRDEMERDAQIKAGRAACAVGGFMCVAIVILEAIFADGVSFATWAVFLSITGTMLTVKYAHLKKRHELVFGVLQLILAALFLVMHAIRLVG